IKAEISIEDSGLNIFDIQIELMQDEQIRVNTIEKINADHKNANDALIEVIDGAVETFRNMNDEYFSARVTDVQDAGDRILKYLNRRPSIVEKPLEENTIFIAEDIAPVDLMKLDLSKIKGFATRAGGKTSHAAIIARSKGIPAVVGCGADLNGIETNDLVIIDGNAGLVMAKPSDELLASYKEKQEAFVKKASFLRSLRDVPALTTDGVKIKLLANISGPNDMEESFVFGSEGSGLFRTELVFMNRNEMPGEEEQFEFYKQTALKSRGRPVIIRTFDIGGDKALSFLNLPVEQNPFLGYRAIRISLDRTDIFIAQLRAILRASAFGQLRIMLPMISQLQEIRQARTILEEVKTALRSSNIPFNPKIELGIMIEIPSAALIADILAREVDFFSIGTNDLCQYTMAVDRMNEQVSHLYDPFNPAVLRLIENTIQQGDKNKIHVGLCGELAAEPMATLLLMGMGLREFSMSASSIPDIKNIIVSNSLEKAKEIYLKVMAMEDSTTIGNFLKEQTRQ
ncbi:MAG: phosphoenolpyruvate--protein phosphotransferase, partial [Chitinophagales bacterium]